MADFILNYFPSFTIFKHINANILPAQKEDTMHKKIYSLVASVLLAFSSIPIHAAGLAVFDISGWLTAIDQLYAQYDMVMNSITQIQNQYMQIQQAVERAKTIDWDNIRFDGDFDIRNDITNANRRINSLLNQAQQIQYTLTTPSIDCGYGQYSIADLCGMGTANHNFFSACKDAEKYMSTGMKSAINALEGNLTDQQRILIWKKYGISPRNYLYVQQAVSMVQTQATKIMAKVTEEAKQLQREERIAKTNAIIQAAYSQTDSYGNMTQAAANEASLFLSQQVIDGLMTLEEAINEMASLSASKMICEENEKQAEAAEIEAEQKRQEIFEQKVPDSFILP